MYQWLIIKRRLEGIIIFPFALLGRLIARFRPLSGEYDIFFFFPFYHVGGAEKVHSEIVKQFPEKKIVIFFTKKSVNDAMLPQFRAPNITIYNVSAYTDNKWLYFLNLIWRGIIAAYIHRQRVTPVVFNGQCNFAYKLSPHLRPAVRQVELIHSFCSFSYIRMPFLPFYTSTVMISRDSIRQHLELYKRYKVPAHFEQRIHLVMNGILLPEGYLPVAGTEVSFPAGVPLPAELSMLYVGRGTIEKRPYLVAQIAKESGVAAGFLGPVEDAIPAALRPYGHFYGEQTDAAVIDDIYRRHRVIMITSSREGFPMVIMEAMARGLAVLATDVGDIPYHVKNGVNGFLIDHTQPEDIIVQQAVQHLAHWQQHPEQLDAIAAANIRYAREHFGMEAFAQAYRSLLLEL